jgi:hypothetical protein
MVSTPPGRILSVLLRSDLSSDVARRNVTSSNSSDSSPGRHAMKTTNGPCRCFGGDDDIFFSLKSFDRFNFGG